MESGVRSETECAGRRRGAGWGGSTVVRFSLWVLAVCLLPHLARSAFDVSQGMRIGSGYATNMLTGNASQGSMVLGTGNHGSAPWTLAVGTNNSLGDRYGYGAIAVGHNNYLNGYQGHAFGEYNQLYGTCAVAIGMSNTGYGTGSLVLGSVNQTAASGEYSLAAGTYTLAAGRSSAAFGAYTTANSLGSVAVGRWNQALAGEGDAASKTTWRPSDPLFVVGNGTSASARSNALTVTKDGMVEIRRLKRQGGIGVGPFTAP